MSWYTNLKIRVKLLVGFIFVTCILVFIGVYSLLQVQKMEFQSTWSYDYATSPLGALGYMTKEFYNLRLDYRDLRQADLTKENLTALEKNFRETITRLNVAEKEFEKAFCCSICEGLYRDYEKMAKEWENKVFDCIKLRLDGKYDEFMTLYIVNRDLGISVAEDKLGALVDAKVKTGKDNDVKNMAIAKSTIKTMVIIIVICVIISIILALYIARLISNPLQTIEADAKHVAETGELTAIPDTGLKDEIGNVHRAMAQMVGNFGNLIKKVMSEIGHINTESEDLSQVSEISANAAVELQSQTQTAASSSERVAENVSTVASSVEELSESIKEIAKNTTAATALTKESEERANQASEVMNRLGQSSLEIGNIVKSITDIAAQTNLLALNATIEAARAGEMGKGFAVVANEVKELAKESAKATEDITNKIKAIQNDTKNAIDVIQVIIENAAKINEVTTSIASAVEEQSVTANEVNKNIDEATTGVGSIVEVITEITKAVVEYTQQANKVKISSATLQTLASGLDTEIKNNFKV